MASVNKFHVEYAFNKWLLLLLLLLFAIPRPVVPLRAGLYPQNLGYNRCLMVWRIAIWTHIFLNVLKNIFPLFNNYFTLIFSLESVLHSEQQERACSNGKPSYLSQRFPNTQKTTPNFEGTWLILSLSFLQNVLCLHLLWRVWYCPESELCLSSSAHTPHLWWEVFNNSEKSHTGRCGDIQSSPGFLE